jgi:tetratricopeptide (TPR) repeat protein
MTALAVPFLLGCTVLAQSRAEDPLQPKILAVYQARTDGRFADAAAFREEARLTLESLPAESPQFGEWARSIAQLYASGGRTVQARAVLEGALGRAGTNAGRIDLLIALADSWRQDRSLKRAAEYLAKAIAAREAAPPRPAAAARPGTGVVSFSGQWFSARLGRFDGADLDTLYRQMAELEQQMGHPQAVANWNAKLRALAVKGGDEELASYLEQHGQLDEAAGMHKAALERAGTAEQAVTQLEGLARIYERQERFADAVAAQQQVIARLEAGGSELSSQAWAARETLARILQGAGRLEAADAVHQDLLARGPAEQQARLAANYAGFLVSTGRAGRALQVLEEFQASHRTLAPGDETALEFAMANAARSAGNVQLAEEYRARAKAMAAERSAENMAGRQLDDMFERAQSAANAGRSEEAFVLAMQAIDSASHTQYRESVTWRVPSIATTLELHEPAYCEQLYRRVEAMAERWAEDNLQPLLNVMASETQFLLGRPERRNDAWALVERYERLLAAAHGADSGMLEDAMRMRVQLGRTGAKPPVSVVPAEDLVAYEESVNGNTSEPYRMALRILAECYESNGDVAHALGVRRQIVQLSDLTLPEGDFQRAQSKADLAMALAGQHDFEEAERLAAEAVQETKGKGFTEARAEIRRLRTAAEKTH